MYKRRAYRIYSFFLFVIFFLNLGILGCASEANIQKSQLQIRAYQTKIFDTKDTKLVMKAVVDTLQDEGFIIKNADTDLGIIVATKELDIESKAEAIISVLFAGDLARWEKVQQIEASINVSPYGEGSKVRAVFLVKTLDNRGDLLKVEQIEDEKYYQQFFTKVSKSLFLLQERL